MYRLFIILNIKGRVQKKWIRITLITRMDICVMHYITLDKKCCKISSAFDSGLEKQPAC